MSDEKPKETIVVMMIYADDGRKFESTVVMKKDLYGTPGYLERFAQMADATRRWRTLRALS